VTHDSAISPASPIPPVFTQKPSLITATQPHKQSGQGGALPSFLPNIAMAAEGPFNAASFAMSLMLAFKTNVSYARW